MDRREYHWMAPTIVVTVVPESRNMQFRRKEVTIMVDKIQLTLYRDSLPAWVAFIPNGDGYKTEHREHMESWLTARGLRREQIDELFRDVEENGEAIITVSISDETGDSHRS